MQIIHLYNLYVEESFEKECSLYKVSSVTYLMQIIGLHNIYREEPFEKESRLFKEFKDGSSIWIPVMQKENM